MEPVALCPVGHIKHWGVGVTSLPILQPGFDVFKRSSVPRPRRQEQLTALTTLIDALGTSVWVTLTFSRAGISQQYTIRRFSQVWAGSLMFS